MKKIAFILIGLAFLTIALFTWQYVKNEQTDIWVCKNGEWVKRGNPATSKPAVGCINDQIGGEKDEHGCLIAAGYQWCPSTEKCQRMWAEFCEEYKDQYNENILLACSEYTVDECPDDCVICPSCSECDDLLCESSSFCQEQGFTAQWYKLTQEGIDSFEKCAAAGFLVMESFPRQCRYQDETFIENINGEEAKKDLIRLESLHDGDKISSPLEIKGEARGVWFFEASFPVVLTDWDGKIIAEGIAQAEDDWMTEDFVPFIVDLEFEADTGVSDRGALIFRKDNPSGLPENDDALEITVFFE